MNTYGYVGANPVNLFDPNGLFPTSCTATPQAVMLCAGATTATGAAVGGATVAAVNVGTQAYDKGWDCIDWDEVGNSGLEGMKWGAILGGGEAVLLAKMGAKAPGVIAGAAGQVTKVRYGPMNPGPLDDAVAATFRGGSYTATTVSKTTTLYRVYGGSAGKLGSYWSRTKPSGPLQSQLDSALAPQWGNTAQNIVSIQVPKGTTIYEGAAAPQSTGVGQILGGGNQIYIPRVDPKWIQ